MIIWIKIQREVSDRVFLGQNVSPFENAGLSDVIDRTASNYNDAKDKFKKIRELIKTGIYDADIARWIPGVLEISRNAWWYQHKRNISTFFPHWYGRIRFPNTTDKQLLCKSIEYSHLFPHENKKNP